jgi:hypothetical protein
MKGSTLSLEKGCGPPLRPAAPGAEASLAAPVTVCPAAYVGIRIREPQTAVTGIFDV